MCPDTVPDADGDGWTEDDGDCDDLDPAMNPDATEVWGDATDNDCDGLADNLEVDDVAASAMDGSSSPTVDYEPARVLRHHPGRGVRVPPVHPGGGGVHR